MPCCRAQAIAVLLKYSARLEQERAAFASKRQVYKGFSREQLSNGVVQRTHSADSMDGFSFSTSSSKRQQVHLEQACIPDRLRERSQILLAAAILCDCLLKVISEMSHYWCCKLTDSAHSIAELHMYCNGQCKLL